MTGAEPAGRVLRLGTRRSRLALAQSGQVARWLEAAHPGLRVELEPIVTRGDRLPGDLSKVGGKGLFTEELEARLLDGRLDLAVHSLKDLPVHQPAGLCVAAFPRREDPRDALLSNLATDLSELPQGAILLTGASRRRAQVLAMRPDLEVRPLRGNVETRIAKWQRSGAHGVLLAAAGLVRLGISDQPIHPLDPEQLVPAPGQGTLAVQTREGDEVATLCAALDDDGSRRAAECERALVATLGGDCALPLAAWARTDGGQALRLVAVVAQPDGSRLVRAESLGTDPKSTAHQAAALLRQQGADAILDAVRRAP